MTDTGRVAVGSEPSAVPRGVHLKRLTSLRGVAALVVFAYHCIAVWPGNAPADVTHAEIPLYSKLFQWIIPAGPACVVFFFILSGFVLRWSSSGQSTKAFLRNRAARVLPLHFATWPIGVALTGTSVGAAVLGAFLLQAWTPNPTYTLAGNGVAWTLSCELFFYLTFPFVYRRIARFADRHPVATPIGIGAVATFLAGFILMFAMSVKAQGPSVRRLVALPIVHQASGRLSVTTALWATTNLPLTRFLEFALGIALVSTTTYLMGRASSTAAPGEADPVVVDATRIRRVPTWIVAVAGLYGLAGYLFIAVGPVHYQALAILPLGLLVLLAAQRDIEGRTSIFTHPVLVRFGEWSFAFYLVHQLVINELDKRFGLASPHLAGALERMAITFAISLVLAGILHHGVERPLVRRLRHRLPVIQGGDTPVPT